MNAAFVTGGAGGAGRAICEAFARRGLGVALADIDRSRAELAAAEIAAATGAACRAVGCDVTSRASVTAAWQQAEAELGPIGVLVNNAGRYLRTEFVDMDDKIWGDTLALNLTGPMLTCQAAIRAWLGRGQAGAIVNVTSIAAEVAGFGGAYDYGASKAGVVGLSTQLAVDFGKHGIRTNVVAPGSFRSPLSGGRLANPGAEAQSAALVPLRRIGEPEDIATAVVFLALDGNYINGEVLRCDGGTTRYVLRPAQGVAG